MMYALVTREGVIIRRQEFVAAPITPGASTGLRWLLDTPPTAQPWQFVQVVAPVAADATAIAYVTPDKPLATIKDEKLAALADLRWQKETGGFVWNSVQVATDDRSQLKITGARLAAQANAEYTVNWKVAPGDFVTLDAPTLIALSDAVRAHVQNSFDAEAAHSAAITSLETAQDVYEYDIAVGW